MTHTTCPTLQGSKVLLQAGSTSKIRQPIAAAIAAFVSSNFDKLKNRVLSLLIDRGMVVFKLPLVICYFLFLF